MDQFKKLAVETAVKKLFSKCHFDICTLNEIGDMIGVNPRQHPDYRFLRGLHCVNYADMDPQLTAQLQQRVLDCLARPIFNPALVCDLISAEGRDFTFTEDRYIDAPPGPRQGLPGRQH
ncbi:hypothetical protein ACEK07_04530 [Alcanivoracaceae bacterium MT1]